jgi:hypothetical protein
VVPCNRTAAPALHLAAPSAAVCIHIAMTHCCRRCCETAGKQVEAKRAAAQQLQPDLKQQGPKFEATLLLSCLDCLSGLVEALGASSEPLVARFNVMALVLVCCRDDNPGVGGPLAWGGAGWVGGWEEVLLLWLQIVCAYYYQGVAAAVRELRNRAPVRPAPQYVAGYVSMCCQYRLCSRLLGAWDMCSSVP